MKEETLSKVRIHTLSEDKFNEHKDAGTLEENNFYLTPAPEIVGIPIQGSEALITSGGVYETFQSFGGTDSGEVVSVNGKTGIVILSANDVGALPNTTVIPTVPTKVSAFENDKGYLTQHQSLANYALKSEIPTKVSAFENDKGYLTQHQSLANYVVTSTLNTELAKKQDKLTFDNTPNADSTNPVTSKGIYDAIAEVIATATGKCKVFVMDTVAELDTWLTNSNNTKDLNTGDIFLIRAVNVPDYWWDKTTQTKQILETTKVDLSTYALKSEIPTVPTKVSAFENDKGYLTQHQSLANYALKSEIPSIPTSLPANGGNADTVDGYHIRVVTSDDGGQTGSITFVLG